MYESIKFSGTLNKTSARELLEKIASQCVRHGPRSVDRPLALYGAGDLGRMAVEYFARLGVPLEFVVDANAANLRNDPSWSGVNLLAPDEVAHEQRGNVLLAVCIVKLPYSDLARQLVAQGWRDVVPFYDIAEGFRGRHPLSNGWFAPPFTSLDIRHIGEALESWADDVSRAHHLQFIAWRRLRKEWVFEDAPISTDDRFFIPEVVSILTGDESFADIGAHVGSVTRRFIENRNGSFDRIWVVEPDERSLEGLNNTLGAVAASIRERIMIIPAVVARDNLTRMFFGGLGYASQCCDIGNEVRTKTIDELDITPSFLKLHLEGMELDALHGAEKTIEINRPIIAVTSYHNSDGLWALPRWMHERLDDYSVLMRLHSWCGTGAVIYGIPKERIGSGIHVN